MDATYSAFARFEAQPPQFLGVSLLEQIALDRRLTVRIEDAAAVMGIHPQKLREQARTPEGREGLGFPVSVAGRSILIPKLPFLRFWGYDGEVA